MSCGKPCDAYLQQEARCRVWHARHMSILALVPTVLSKKSWPAGEASFSPPLLDEDCRINLLVSNVLSIQAALGLRSNRKASVQQKTLRQMLAFAHGSAGFKSPISCCQMQATQVDNAQGLAGCMHLMLFLQSQSLHRLFCAAESPARAIFGPISANIPCHCCFSSPVPSQLWSAGVHPVSELVAYIHEMRACLQA